VSKKSRSKKKKRKQASNPSAPEEQTRESERFVVSEVQSSSSEILPLTSSTELRDASQEEPAAEPPTISPPPSPELPIAPENLDVPEHAVPGEEIRRASIQDELRKRLRQIHFALRARLLALKPYTRKFSQPLFPEASDLSEKELKTGQVSAVSIEMVRLASPLTRLCAFLYDLLFLILLNLGIFGFAAHHFLRRFMAPVDEGPNGFHPLEAKHYLLYACAASFVLCWLYFALIEALSVQGTIGKRLFRIRTTDHGGNKISFLRSNLRMLGKLVSCATLGIGFAISLFRKDKRTLHDIIADTQVLKDAV